MDSSASSSDSEQQVNLLEVVIANENISLNVLVQFLNIAQRRGAFTLGEASKIFECVQFFLPKQKEDMVVEQLGDEGEMPLQA